MDPIAILQQLRAEWPNSSALTLIAGGLVLGWTAGWLVLKQRLNHHREQIDQLRYAIGQFIEKSWAPDIARQILESTRPQPPAFFTRWTMWGLMLGALVLGIAYYRTELAKAERDNYPYITTRIGDASKLDQSVTLLLKVLGEKGGAPAASMWISPAAAKRDAKNPAYFSMFGIYPRFVTPTGADLGITVKPGEYIVEVDTQYGHIDELLRVVPVDGKLMEIIDIKKNGQLVYSSPRPRGFEVPNVQLW